MKLAFLGCVALAMGLAAPAMATTVTIGFEGITDFGGGHGPTVSTEDGVTIELSDGYDEPDEPVYDGYSGVVHLDDLGTAYSSSVLLTFAGTSSLVSLDIEGLGIDSWYYPLVEDGDETFVDSENPIPFAYENLLIEAGGPNGAATRTLSTGTFPGWETIMLDSAFGAVDWLRITALSPISAPAPGEFDCTAPCGHFNIDNVVIAAVPLPPALPALAAALSLLALSRRRKAG